MKPFLDYMKNSKRLLRIILNSKKMVAVICVFSMFATLLLVRLIRSVPTDTDDEGAVLLHDAIKDKKAVSVLFDIAKLPLEIIYPGVKIDLLNRDPSGEIDKLVSGVTVVGLSFLPDKDLAKLFIAVDEQESIKILEAGNKDLDIVVLGENPNTQDIEIIEY